MSKSNLPTHIKSLHKNCEGNKCRWKIAKAIIPIANCQSQLQHYQQQQQFRSGSPSRIGDTANDMAL